MLTEFARDHAFTIAWFGLMAIVWFGWAQEDPPARWRWRLGAGSVLGILLTGVFVYAVVIRWGQDSALDGKEAWFGVLTAAEVVLAGAGCLVLAVRRRKRWMSWWVAMVVGVHFLPLAWLLEDWSLALLGVIEIVVLCAVVPRGRQGSAPLSRQVGPVMGVTLLAFAAVSTAVFLVRVGVPWQV